MQPIRKSEQGNGVSEIGIKKALELKEISKGWKGIFSLNKYDFSSLEGRELQEAENDHKTLSSEAMKDKWGHLLIEDKVIGENLLLNEGINAVWTLVAGGSETAYNNANARLGVGDSTTAAAATQTALQAATNTLFKAMDAGYPTFGTSQQIVFRSTFASADANFSWQEFSCDNGNAANKNLNRLVSNQGTKTSGQSWQLTLTVTLS